MSMVAKLRDEWRRRLRAFVQVMGQQFERFVVTFDDDVTDQQFVNIIMFNDFKFFD